MAPSLLVYHCASDIPDWIMEALRRHGRNSNTIFPQIEKSRRHAPDGQQLWIVYASDRKIEYVLAVTEGVIDAYPVFIFTTKPVSSLAGRSFVKQMNELAVELRKNVDDQRVYSVFALKPVSTTFCKIWADLTCIPAIKEPYYDAFISYCTRETLKGSQRSPAGHEYDMRLAKMSDLGMVADLCRGFSDECPPFILDSTDAETEARYLINNRIVWLYMIREAGMRNYDVASIAACTRNTDGVAALTKVFTTPAWRGRGCAGRLVRHVCKEMLDKGKESVVLYVGIDNPARSVYAKVGFVGLGANDGPVEGVDRWLEIGFDPEHVDLGHW